LIAPDVNSAQDDFQGTAFTGCFDGGGFAIRHLKIDATTSVHLGLFGKIGPEGEICDVHLDDVRMICFAIMENWSYFPQPPMGGLTAENVGTIRNCSVTDVIAMSGIDCGGLAGINRGQILTSYTADGTVYGGENAGGLVGSNVSGTISDCYARIFVATGTAIGGLVGRNEDGTICCCYSTGLIGEGVEKWTGGLVGRNDEGGAVLNSFWDVETSGWPTSAGGTGLTTQEMMDPMVYALNGWAENPAWVIDSGNDYPRLAWEGTPGEPVPDPNEGG
jgi:hypothetical protein